MSNYIDTSARAALLELHRQLLQAQRLEAERFVGRMSAGTLLQAAAGDVRFDWLQELSGLISALDQAHANADTDAGAALRERARGLIATPDPQTEFGARYLQALQLHPDVVLAHRDATAALAA